MKNLNRSTLLVLLFSGAAQAERVRVVPRESASPSRVEQPVARGERVTPARTSRPEPVRVVPRTRGDSPREKHSRPSYGGGSSYPQHHYRQHHYRHYPRYYGNHFYHYPHRWWYDPTVSHWTFWANGYWWWPGPGGVTYVYVNDGYYPYESSNVYVPVPETPSAPPPEAVENPKAPVTESTMKSPNGKRMVQIAGEFAEAFLYDTTRKEPVFMKVLGKDATRARFSGGTGKEPLVILIDYADGRFGFFSESGEAIDPTRTQ